ncbi:MAG TPA: ATP-binding protein [Solirubrobacteraceae bacterium]|nr:ATP-binding protein [Solirubrobacteraceae bacterium]
MRRSITTQVIITFALVSAVVVAAFAVMTVTAGHLQSIDHQRSGSTRALVAANQLEQSVLDLETGLRGYLLADRPGFLQPYKAAVARYPHLAESLQAATVGDPRAHQLSVAISAAVSAYVSRWTVPVIRTAQGNIGAARRLEAGGGGKARVDAMRGQFSTLLDHETTIHTQQVNRASDLATLVRVLGIGATVLFLILIVAAALRTQWALVAPLRRLAGAVSAITAGDLSARVPEGGAAEVGAVVSGFNAMADALARQRESLDDHQSELEAQKSELEQALAALEERSSYIERVREFGDRMVEEGSSVETVVVAALRGLGDGADCEVGAVYLRDGDEDRLRPVATRGVMPEDVAATIEPPHGLAGRAVAEAAPVSVSYGETTLQIEGLAGPHRVLHELHLPIRHGEETIGAISLGRLHDEPFSPIDRQLISDLAERTGSGCMQALATRRLSRTARDLGAVLQTIDEGVYGVDTAGRVTLVNRAALELTGFTREELAGGNSHELLHHTHEDGSPYPLEECPVFRAMQTGTAIRVTDEVFWRRDGTPFPVEYSAAPLFEEDKITGAVVTFLDRTARRQLARQRDTVHAITRVFAEGASLQDSRPLMLAAVCEGLGFELGFTWQPAEEGGVLRPVSSYAAPGYEDLVATLGSAPLPTEGTLAGLGANWRDPVVCADLVLEPPRPGLAPDPRLRIGVSLPVLSRDGGLISVAELFCSRDISQDGLLDTLRAVAAQVAQHIERQRADEETQRMKDQIVANVSHELRTPLTAIDGWVHVLLGEEPGPLTDEQHRFLQIVKRNSDRLMRLVGDLLVAGQIEAGKLNLELEDVDVAAVARDTAESVAHSAQSKRIALMVHAAGSVHVRGDRQRLGQLLSNLVANAIKFTPDDGSVDIRVREVEGTCRISVADTGIGIPRADRKHLFERFYRASTATASGITGTGLGLAISKAIAESHGGTLELADEDGPGTVFVVELPLTLREEVCT